MRWLYNEALESYLSLKTGNDEVTRAVMNKIKEVFPQINSRSDIKALYKVSGKKRPGLVKIGAYAEEQYDEVPLARPGLIAKLWRMWWVIWSHIEPTTGVLWERGFMAGVNKHYVTKDRYIKFENFGWIDQIFFSMQRNDATKINQILVGYDPDQDEIYI